MSEDELRITGINLYFDDKKNILCPKLVTAECTVSWDELDNNVDCPDQGFLYMDEEEFEDED